MVTSGQYQRSTRGRLPDWFLAQPPKIRGDDCYLEAFWRLHTTRAVSQGGIGPIPWHRAWEYGVEVLELARHMREFFASVVIHLDALYRQHLLDEQEKTRRRAEREAARKAARAEGRTARRR